MSKGKCSSKYIDERNRQLYNAYKKVVGESPVPISMDEICKKIVCEPCTRFWISTEQALRLISSIKRDKKQPIGTLRQEMIRLIKHRAFIIMKSNKDIPYFFAVERAVYSPAPCFYLNPNSAKTILCNYKLCKKSKSQQSYY